MKEQPTSSHNRVATGINSSHHHGSNAASRSDNNNASKCFGGPCLDSEEEEEDWDLGIGKLVIDLDADADKGRSPPSTKGLSNNANTVTMSTGTSPQKAPSKSGVSMDANVQGSSDKGLKVKIKRSSGKSSSSSSTLTSTSIAVGSTSSAVSSHKQEGKHEASSASNNKQLESKLSFGTNLSEVTAPHHSALPSTMDRLKHSLAEKEKTSSSSSSSSSSSKNRSSHKKDRSSKSDRTKGPGSGSNDQPTTSGVGTFSLSAATTTLGVTPATAGLAPPTGTAPSTGPGVTNSVTVDLDRMAVAPFGSNNAANGKREQPSHDPYEFNAKVEDRIGVPMKKIKVEKVEAVPSSSTTSLAENRSTETQEADRSNERHNVERPKERRDCERPTEPRDSSDRTVEKRERNKSHEDHHRKPEKMETETKHEPQESATSSSSSSSSSREAPRRDMAVETSHVGVVTDPDCLGPCEPGTSVVLEGLVWNETNNGLLVVNVTWRGKTYVGTLMDATKHCWAPPRLNCDSPSSDFESRTPKGRGKRGRGAGPPPKPIDNGSDRKLRSNRRSSNNTGMFAAPPSPRCDGLGSKRKAPDPAMFDPPKSTKRSRTDGRVIDTSASAVASTSGDGTGLIECPEPNCSKKYRHINGLKYHQTHAHKQSSCASGPSEEVDKNEKPPRMEPASPHPSSVTSSDSTPKHRAKEAASTSAPEPKDSTTPSRKKTSEKKSVEKSDNSLVKIKEEPVDTLEKVEKVQIAKERKEETRKSTEKTAFTVNSNNTDSKKSSKPVQIAPATSVKVPCTTAPLVYQISGGQVGLVTSTVSMVTQASSQVAMETMGTTLIKVNTPVKPVSAPNVIPVPVSAVTTVPTTVAIPTVVKVEGEKKKKDKSEKSKHKSPVTTTRPIMPAPSTQATVAVTAISTQAGITQVNTVSSLKPIQPKPTVLGETSKVNPALASLKEMKEKKPKKKKKDKDRERHKDSEKSHHEHKHKVDMPSVIKTAPAATAQVARPNGEPTLITVQKVVPSTPPQLEKQQPVPVGKGKEQPTVVPVPISQNRPQLVTPSHKPVVESHNQNTLHANQEQDAHSPAYSDISDANESAPTLEKETQPLQEEPAPSERPPSVQTQDSHGVYSPYYGQPPFLTPAVPTGGQEAKDGQIPATVVKAPLKSDIGVKEQVKMPQAPPNVVIRENERKESISRTQSGSKVVPLEQRVSATQPEKSNQQLQTPQQQNMQQHVSQQQSAPVPSTQQQGMGPQVIQQGTVQAPQQQPMQQQSPQQAGMPPQNAQQQQQQQQQQQKPGMGGQYQYVNQYYIDQQNYMQLMATNPEMRERFMEEQRRRHEQMQQSQQQQQQQQHTSQHPHQQQLNQQSQQHHSGQQMQQHQQTQQPQAQQHQQQRHGMDGPQHASVSKQTSHSSSHSASQSQPSPSNPQHQNIAASKSSQNQQNQHSPQLPQSSHHQPQNQIQTTQSPHPHGQQSHPQGQRHSPQVKQSHHQQPQQPAKTYIQLQPVQRSPHGHQSSEHDRNKSHSSSSKSKASSSSSSESRPDHKESDERPLCVKKPPPSLISDREREEQRRRDRDRADTNLREKQNENREILKENIALKEQMDIRKFDNSYSDPKMMYDNKQELERRYYMFQQQRYMEQQQRYMEQQAKSAQENGKSREQAVSSPQDKPDGNEVGGKQQPQQQPKNNPKSRDQDDHSKEVVHPKIKEEERPKSVDRTSATSSPRGTPKPSKEQGGQNPGGPVPIQYNPYYGHPYQQFGNQIPFDPNHPAMYPGVNPVMGYASTPYIHPSQIRYHVPGAEGMPAEKPMMLSPGAPRPEGKALNLLQQHAQYYNSGNTPHKIHELQDVAKRNSEKARSTGSPAAKETERPDSRNSTTADGKPREGHRTSPPTQRHLHTHHHTHVMGPGYPMSYGPYGAQSPIMSSPNSNNAPAAVTPTPVQPHSFVPK